MFECTSMLPDGYSQCIHEKNVCNNIPDCSDESDETSCPGKFSVPLLFTYQNTIHLCFPVIQWSRNLSNLNMDIACDSHDKIVLRYLLMLGSFNEYFFLFLVICGENLKECNRECISEATECKIEACEFPRFRCHDGYGCVDAAQKCDGVNQCTDGSDEKACRKFLSQFQGRAQTCNRLNWRRNCLPEIMVSKNVNKTHTNINSLQLEKYSLVVSDFICLGIDNLAFHLKCL